jgi:hypothetical protein
LRDGKLVQNEAALDAPELLQRRAWG